jgi:hypothetical protein
MANSSTTAPDKKKGTRLLTPKFRVSFPQVFEKASYNNGKPRFSLTGLFFPEEFSEAEKAKWQAIRAKLAEVCLEFHKKDLKTCKEDRTFKIPFHKGDEKKYEGYGNPKMIFFSMANSKHRPKILDAAGKQITAENSEDFYAGCWARASVNPYGFNNIGKGLAIGLGNLQKVKDDKSFEGMTSAEDDFGDDPLEDFGDDDDLLAGEDDSDDLGA